MRSILVFAVALAVPAGAARAEDGVAEGRITDTGSLEPSVLGRDGPREGAPEDGSALVCMQPDDPRCSAVPPAPDSRGSTQTESRAMPASASVAVASPFAGAIFGTTALLASPEGSERRLERPPRPR
ncbi:MAG: hypothetical protein NZ898_08270 [Myxococcota bacterium]|nr:hypothetical protein [Myxococcota bacterium]MDW8364020.1 hypothetical protein [Myxococcales bacterium]